jgi:hypothetical protein
MRARKKKAPARGSRKLGLPVEPRLRDEHRQQAEYDREGDHHDGTGTHGGTLENADCTGCRLPSLAPQR